MTINQHKTKQAADFGESAPASLRRYFQRYQNGAHLAGRGHRKVLQVAARVHWLVIVQVLATLQVARLLAARLLGIGRRSLYCKLEEHGL